jgi:hypothetical protein
MLVEIVMEGAMQEDGSKLRRVDGVDAAAAVAELIVRHGQAELRLGGPQIVVGNSGRCRSENDQGQNLRRARDR